MLRVVQAPAGLEDFGPWRAHPAPVAFSAAEAPPMVFRFDLPTDRMQAHAELDAADHWAQHTQRCLDALPDHTQALLQRLEQPVAFDVGRLPPADAWLSQQMLDPAAVDFGVREKIEQGLQAILAVMTRLAQVDTHIEGQLIARTRLSIGGDIETITRTLVTPADMALHTQAVATARASKNAWMRLITAVINVARALMQFAINPVAGVIALPRAWRYIKRILAEARLL